LGICEEKLFNIPNGVDTDYFVPPPPEAKASIRKKLSLDGRFVILSVGSQQKVKGLEQQLHAVTRLKNQIPNLCYLHIGREADATQDLKRTVTELGLQNIVVFAGETADVLPYLQAADIFALPSLGEGLSNALLEAMSTGLPVIATDVSGSQDLVRTGDTGILVPAGDVVLLTRACEILFLNAELRNECGQRARQRIQQSYSLTEMVRRYIELYNSILESR
jgi:glycosyltransferase involved in cell wall biosynthesis